MSSASASDAGGGLGPEPGPGRRSRALRWGREAALVLLVFWAISWWQTRKLVPTDGRMAPEVVFTDLQGGEHRLSELQGKSVQLHFWATWCGVCRVEYGALNSVFAGLDEDEALIAAVADGEDAARVQAYLAEHGIQYPVWVADRAALEAFQVSSFPTNFFLDAEGRLQGSDVGMATRLGMKARMGCAR